MSKNNTATVTIPASTIEFLIQLKENNTRDWFNAHKDEFVTQQTYIEEFASALLGVLNLTDVIETPSGKKSLYRIYRDTRFSKDKTPYKSHWSGSFKRATKQRRGGYYFHIEKGNSFVAGGFWAPSPADIKLIREDIAFDGTPIRKIIGSKEFVANFGTLKGEQLATAPKGFAKDDPEIDLLRYKQFLLVRKFEDKEVLDPGFLQQAGQTFAAMRPFFDYMSAVLTGDANGEAD